MPPLSKELGKDVSILVKGLNKDAFEMAGNKLESE
jgi:hypothetical protein